MPIICVTLAMWCLELRIQIDTNVGLQYTKIDIIFRFASNLKILGLAGHGLFIFLAGIDIDLLDEAAFRTNKFEGRSRQKPLLRNLIKKRTT